MTALFIQNTNPMMVAPDLATVHKGFAREDLFTCVHEQFMTDTAKMADIVMPATMFLEHDDVYQGGGHQYIILGPKVIEPLPGTRSNVEVINALAKRLGCTQPAFDMTARQLVDETLKASKRGSYDQLLTEKWVDCQIPFEQAHFLDGFAWPDKKFRFKADWQAAGPIGDGTGAGHFSRVLAAGLSNQGEEVRGEEGVRAAYSSCGVGPRSAATHRGAVAVARP